MKFNKNNSPHLAKLPKKSSKLLKNKVFEKCPNEGSKNGAKSKGRKRRH